MFRVAEVKERLPEVVKETLPEMVIWMAKTAVMEGVKNVHRYEKQGNAIFYEAVRVSAEVLWKLFCSTSRDCQKALEVVAETKDGYSGNSEDYLDTFIFALANVRGGSVKIRVKE